MYFPALKISQPIFETINLRAAKTFEKFRIFYVLFFTLFGANFYVT